MAATRSPVASGRRRLLELLICPSCSGALMEGPRSPRARFAERRTMTALECVACRRQWPIRRATPVFARASNNAAAGAAPALLRRADVDRWEHLRRLLERLDPALHAEVFDDGRDDWRFLLPLPESARALVVGAGWGRLAVSLADICAHVYAITLDEEQAAFINSRAGVDGKANVLALAAGIDTLPFPVGAFDLIALPDATLLTAHGGWSRAVAHLTRLRMLLAPDGVLLLGVEARAGVMARLGRSRWRHALSEAGFGQVERLLALPDCRASTYVLQAGPRAPSGMVLRAYAGQYLEPKTTTHRLARWILRQTTPPPALAELCAGHWLLAGRTPRQPDTLFSGAGLPPGEWGVLAARGRSYRGARAHFAAFDPHTADVHFRVKVAREAAAAEAVAREATTLERLHQLLPPDLLTTLPPSLGRFHVHGHPATAQGHLEGQTLANRLERIPARRRPRLAGELLGQATRWLTHFHRETARPTPITGELLDRLVLSDLRRFLEVCPHAPRARTLFTRVMREAESLLGERLPLVCEHRDFQTRNILLDGRTLRVVGWDLAVFDSLPLGDFYELVHSLAFQLADDGRMERPGEMLSLAYGGQGEFSRAVGFCLRAYCDRLGLSPNWGSIVLPLLMARKALLHKEQFASGMDGHWTAVGLRYLEAPEEFPVLLGQTIDTPRGRPGR